MRRTDRRVRQPSNVFSMLTPSQITSIKEVFSMIDRPKDEVISQTDLLNFLPSIVNESQMKEFSAIEKDINFYALLSLLSDKFIGLNSKEKINTLLRSFSDDKKTVSKSELISYLGADGMDVTELEYCLSVFQFDRIAIDQLANLLRHGEIEPNLKKE